MRLTVALDPGLRASGLAVFEGAVLKHAAIVRPEIHHRETLPAVVVMCEGLVAMIDTARAQYKHEALDLIVEYPQVYQRVGGKTKGDPNDLLPLAAVCGGVAACVVADLKRAVHPSEWKGSVDGDVFTERIKQRLTKNELVRLPVGSLAHNAIDAVGLGLWYLNRLERRRVYAKGAT